MIPKPMADDIHIILLEGGNVDDTLAAILARIENALYEAEENGREEGYDRGYMNGCENSVCYQDHVYE